MNDIAVIANFLNSNLDTPLNELILGGEGGINDYYTNMKKLTLQASSTLTTVLNITGKGKLHAIYCKGVCNAGKGIFLKVTVDDEIFINKGMHVQLDWSGSLKPDSVMILTNEFIPTIHDGSSFLNPLIPDASYGSLVVPTNYTDGKMELVDGGSGNLAIVRFLKKIQFNKSVKVEAYSSYSSGSAAVYYSMDE